VKASARTFVLFPLTTFRRIVDYALIVAILGTLLLFGLQFPHAQKLDATWLVIRLHRFGDPFITAAGWPFKLSWPPAAPPSFFPLGVALALWLVKIAFDATLNSVESFARKLFPPPALAKDSMRGPDLTAEGADMISPMTEQEREELLRRYREIQKALTSSKRKKCTFLAIDVVGSTKMKVGERDTDIAATFQAYEEMLKKTFDKFGAWKQAWTPDGVMICFLEAELAIGAGQSILMSLPKFNEHENKLRTPFSVRCGLHFGEVTIFEDSKLEKVADHVIDVAGHLQKMGSPDTLALSADVYNLLSEKAGFHATQQLVDGYEVYSWAPEIRQAVTETGSASS
jgi:class 3 adenylate cyclase